MTPYQRRTAELAVANWLAYFGEDPTRPGLRETPRRVVDAWLELLAGYGDPPTMTSFEDASDQVVVVRGIEFVSLCEHHLLPFIGEASVGYIPNGRLLGLSKMPRLVHYYARRLQVQERLTQQIADHIAKAITPVGVAVVVTAEHLCARARGVRVNGARTITSAMLGAFRDKPEARAEFLALLQEGR
jgi:GTP cyclohydrolase I